jgi:hypothetical protein
MPPPTRRPMGEQAMMKKPTNRRRTQRLGAAVCDTAFGYVFSSHLIRNSSETFYQHSVESHILHLSCCQPESLAR